MRAQAQDSNAPIDQGLKGRNMLKMASLISPVKISTDHLAFFVSNLALLSGGIIR